DSSTLIEHYAVQPCGTPTATPPASTPTRTSTPVAPTRTATVAAPSSTAAPPSATRTPAPPTQTQGGPTATTVPSATRTPVPPTSPFWAVIETAAADQIVSGYACGGPGEACDSQHRPYFRPYANVTRGQLAKIDVLAAAWVLQNPAMGSFEDVLPGSAFYEYV